ncbi:Paired amphipathic helix pst1 [Lecanosticta acicola]|uniref:Paired amphipathic helix pst1 n=1 Tax=Lecanosticta acicola TaxID=111012 RepID=A0AAI8Z6L4_9PEZI|nr:Paired amphipathic helix pst1 [Lecanosticta acicola]
MEPHRSWPHQGGGNSNESQRPPGAGFGPGTPQHPTQQSPPSGPSGAGAAGGLPPPGSAFPPFHQHQHPLANLAGISQASPRQAPSQSAHRPDEAQPRPPPAAPGAFGLPSLSQATGQPPHAAAAERERERERDRERDREREREEHRIHIKEEEDRRHREQERQRLEQAPPHQAQQGPPVHLHQPVAVGPRTVHGPNGLLGNPQLAGPGPGPGPGPQSQQHLPLGAPTGPGNIFAGGPVQPAQGPGSQQMQPGLLAPYGPGAQAPPAQQQQPPPPAQQQQMGGQPQQQGQGQGQQPILNDALSYLDQVKVQFADHPDVYNRFLDIMKDFKSGAIDTPGVIGRVSTLFAGNPELIQGFNTFLPPGYRIECGTGDDPNSIRVTTPMGTTVSSMPQPRPLSRQEGGENYRPSNGTYTPQPGGGGAQQWNSPSARTVGPAAPGQHLSSLEAARQQQEQQAIHQQEQRGVITLQSAVSAAAGGAGLRAGISPRATPMPAGDGGAGAEGVAPEKRGPVEFNHAISYVNKIKNRFASHPDIYKQFLEILQTYQRESKPIQDVYSQVTHLFKTAPDLLEDFKQFLPESAAHAKQAAERARQEAENNVMTSNVRGEGGGMYGSPVMSREPHMGTPGHGGKLPPVGNFAPTPASKDNKRKREQRQGTAGAPDGVVAPSNSKPHPGQANKRVKTGAGQALSRPNEQPPSSPSLIPSLPTPLEPTTTSAATSEELAFFDKAKKAIGNKGVMNEFLKLCNLFSQDLISREVLVFRARAFIGSNPDLMKWFTDWLGYDERDVVVENKPRVPTGRVMLSNCRGLGPSYRLLPKRERQKPCSGRDELCNSVLNDDWASHPTWASEDSGFIAHKKNLHEEGLHRIEEERHDYDYNIEACSRTIQLIEPIAQTLRRLPDNEQKEYRLPHGLGGQSETIYKRVIMKLYGRERGSEVIHSLHERPYQVIPVVLNRLKERLESWKMAQREWEKVWREQTQKMFWKSLDHQGVDSRKNDRRQFQTKALQSEIQLKYEEGRRQAQLNPALVRKPQYEYAVGNPDVIVDTTSLILEYVNYTFGAENFKFHAFIVDFVCLFFGLDPDNFRERLDNAANASPSNENADEAFSGGEDSASSKPRKGGAVKNGGLLRAALDRGRPVNRANDSNAGSRASTPGHGSNAEDEVADPIAEAENRQDVGSARWLEHPMDNNKLAGKNINPHEPQSRNTYRLWANTSIFCFFRLFLMLYERLCDLKSAEAEVKEAVLNASRAKPAIELGIVDKLPTEYFTRSVDGVSYYDQMLDKFREVLKQETEYAEVEDTLRRFYLSRGYRLYAFEKIISTMARDAENILKNDGKDKSADLFALFKKDRQKESTTVQQQADYRKAVEKMVKDSEIYRIDYHKKRGKNNQHKQDQEASRVKIFLSKRDDLISDDGLTVMDRENKWRYYIASYTSVDPTDGVDTNAVSQPLLWRSIRAFGADPRETSFTLEGEERAISMKNNEQLVLRIAVNTYKPVFEAKTAESFHASFPSRQRGAEGCEAVESVRSQRDDEMLDRFVHINKAMTGASAESVESANATFSTLVEKGVGAGSGDGEAMDVDE